MTTYVVIKHTHIFTDGQFGNCYVGEVFFVTNDESKLNKLLRNIDTKEVMSNEAYYVVEEWESEKLMDKRTINRFTIKQLGGVV